MHKLENLPIEIRVNDFIATRSADFIKALPDGTRVIVILYGSVLQGNFNEDTSDIDVVFSILPPEGKELDDIFTTEVDNKLAKRGWRQEQHVINKAGQRIFLEPFVKGGRRYETQNGKLKMEGWVWGFTDILNLFMEEEVSGKKAFDAKGKTFDATSIAALIIGTGQCVYYTHEELLEAFRLIRGTKFKSEYFNQQLFDKTKQFMTAR